MDSFVQNVPVLFSACWSTRTMLISNPAVYQDSPVKIFFFRAIDFPNSCYVLCDGHFFNEFCYFPLQVDLQINQ